MMRETPTAEGQVAVLIDAENVGLGSVEPLLDQVSNVGRITIKRAYGDWSAGRGGREQLERLGIEPVHHFHSTKSGKNSSDIRLAIDAMDLMHSSPVDAFVLVSADTDFVPLIRRLRAAGKTVIGAGHRAIVSETLVKSCDWYIHLEDLAVPARAQGPAQPGSDADALLLRALAASMNDQGEVTGSRLHETMQRIDPSFDYKALGFRTFFQFLEQSQEIDVSRPGSHGDVIVGLRPAVPLNGGGQPRRGGEPPSWDMQIHQAWSVRAKASGDSIPGSWAGGEAARVLGVTKLSSSSFRTLQHLLDASDSLKAHWSRNRNAIVRR